MGHGGSCGEQASSLKRGMADDHRILNCISRLAVRANPARDPYFRKEWYDYKKRVAKTPSKGGKAI